MELMTIEEVANLLKVKPKSIINWRYQGVLPLHLTTKIGRHVYFFKADLIEHIKSKRQSEI